jgi:hypothetical protein
MLTNRNRYNAHYIRLQVAMPMFGDFDTMFRRYMEHCRFSEISALNGLKVKGKNSIVKPWPLRLGKRATKEEFDVLLASSHLGSERYVEWERAI